MADQEGDFYQRLRNKIHKWAESKEGKSNKWSEYLLLAPDMFHLLCKLSFDPEVPTKEKAKLAAAIAYWIFPFDIIPEAIVGPIGYLDDLALAAYVLNSIVNNTNPEVVRKHWAGDGDILEVIKRVLAVADQMLGSGLWKKVKNVVK